MQWPGGSSILWKYWKKTYYLSSYTRESQLLRLRSTLTQIISYCVTSLFNQGQVRVFWFLETRPKNNRNYDNGKSNETEITPHSLLVNSILKLFLMYNHLIREYTFCQGPCVKKWPKYDPFSTPKPFQTGPAIRWPPVISDIQMARSGNIADQGIRHE